jgi:hypothetical protein
VHSHGKNWLFTIAEQTWRPRGGERVATIGPLVVDRDVSYSAHYSEAVISPGFQNEIAGHRHPGPEAWFILTGGQCLETPNGVMVGLAGQSMLAPEVGRWRSPASALTLGDQCSWSSTEVTSDTLCLSMLNPTRPTRSGNRKDYAQVSVRSPRDEQSSIHAGAPRESSRVGSCPHGLTSLFVIRSHRFSVAPRACNSRGATIPAVALLARITL